MFTLPGSQINGHDEKEPMKIGGTYHIEGLFLRPKFQRRFPQNMAKHTVLTYLHIWGSWNSHWRVGMKCVITHEAWFFKGLRVKTLFHSLQEWRFMGLFIEFLFNVMGIWSAFMQFMCSFFSMDPLKYSILEFSGNPLVIFQSPRSRNYICTPWSGSCL